MGLLFALEADRRQSQPKNRLTLRSNKKKIGLAGGFFFGAVFLAILFLAAKPIFDKFWSEGLFLDKSITAFFYFVLFAYPFLILFCFLYENVVEIKKTETKQWDISSHKSLGFIKWKKANTTVDSLNELTIVNWVGKINAAAIKANQSGKKDRYATKGHWLLQTDTQPPVILERRANRDEIDWLRDQIMAFFGELNKDN